MRYSRAFWHLPAVVVMTVAAWAGLAGTPAVAVIPDLAASGGAVASATLAPLPAEFATRARPAQLPAGEARSCPVPAAPGRVQCMALARTGLPARLGVRAGITPVGYSPANLQAAYALTSASATSGTAEVVAVVAAYDDPTVATDLAVYRQQWGLPPCDQTTHAGCVEVDNQAGQASPLPPAASPAGDWTWEESSDVDTVTAICPDCYIDLIEANSATASDLRFALQTATGAATFVVNGWGSPEFLGESAYDNFYFGSSISQGKAIVFAAGDAGYGTAWPAASPDVTAVGGTSLTPDTSAARGWDETTWSGTGSGCAIAEPKPTWQTLNNATPPGCLNRTENDVAAVADPRTGVAVYDGTAGPSRPAGWGVAGGTNVAASLVTAVYALAGHPTGNTFAASYPYQLGHAADLFPVTSGSDGTCESGRAYLCTAVTGYNGPAGLGTPDGIGAFSNNVTPELVTVADPGTQDYEAGWTISLGISAFDSAAQTLSYTATGLPAGLSIAPSTGVISGTLLDTPATSQVTVTATGLAGVTGSATFRIVTVASTRTGYQPVSGPFRLNLAGKCLDDRDGKTDRGTPVQSYDCLGNANQTWTFQPEGGPGGEGTITFAGGHCLDIDSQGTTNNYALHLWDCNGNASQRWKISSDDELVNPISGRCATVPGGQTGNAVQLVLYDCSAAPYQQWTPYASPVQSGLAGNCLDDRTGSLSAGTVVQIYKCLGNANQRWIPEPDESIHFGPMCLDVTGGGKLDGTTTVLQTCDGAASQKWIIGPAGQLENVNAGKCLDSPGDSTVSATQLILNDCYGDPGEIWVVT